MGVVRTHWLYRWIFCCSSFASYLKLLLEKWEGNCCLFAFFTKRKWFVKSIFFSTSAPQKTWQKKIKGICIFFLLFSWRYTSVNENKRAGLAVALRSAHYSSGSAVQRQRCTCRPAGWAVGMSLPSLSQGGRRLRVISSSSWITQAQLIGQLHQLFVLTLNQQWFSLSSFLGRRRMVALAGGGNDSVPFVGKTVRN